MSALAVAGHNRTPFELSQEEIEDLFMEAKNWLDGSGVHSEDDANAVSKLLDDLRKAEKRADDRRVDENRPFDDGKAEVQARYAPLIGKTKAQSGKTVLAMDACKKALQPWLLKLDAEKKAKAEAARKEADSRAAEAQAAMQAARMSDLTARQEAENALQVAKMAERAADRAENDKAHAVGGSRAIGLRTTYQHELIDVKALAAWAWRERYDELCAFLDTLAKTETAAGRRGIPGVAVHEIMKL